MTREVLKMALEAWQTSAYGTVQHHKSMLVAMTEVGKAILAQPEQGSEDTISNRRIISEDPGATISIMQGMQRTIDSLKSRSEQDVDYWIKQHTEARQAELELRRELEAMQPEQKRSCGICGEDEAFTGCCGGGRNKPNALCYTPSAQPEQAQETWTTPTTFLRRFGDAMQALCKGHRPTDESMSEWVDPASGSIELQHFACQYGFAWAQGIGLIDAALVAADQPTEGPSHEYRVELVMPEQEPMDLPEGKRLILVDGTFDELVYWLDRCDRKGHLERCGDLEEPWANFDYEAYTSPPKRQPLKQATIADAPGFLNISDKSMWVVGWNECVKAHDIGDNT